MKKIFSAFLLMTMMVFSVGSFVSCSDLENEIAKVDTQATENAAAIADLNSKLTALQTALTAAQADADAAMAAAQAAQKAGDDAKAQAEAAKAAAATAKAEAIAEATAKVEALKAELQKAIDGKANAEDVKALQDSVAQIVEGITNLNGRIDAHDVAIEDLEMELSVLEKTLAEYKTNLDALNLLSEDLKAAIEVNVASIVNLKGQLDAQDVKVEDLEIALAKVVADVKTINEALVAVAQAIAGQIQSITYVPEFNDKGIVAHKYSYKSAATKESNDVTALVLTATYEVRPAHLAELVTVDNAYLAGVRVKADNVERLPITRVTTDTATGRVVVYAKVASNTKAYKTITQSAANTDPDEVYDATTLALCVEQENPVEAAESTDLGTYISSNYVAVENNTGIATSIYTQYAFKSGNSYVTTYGTLQAPKNVNVPYNWSGTDAAVKNLFPITVMVKVGEQYVTPEVATTIFGKNLVPTYTAATTPVSYSDMVDEDEDDKEESPINVEGNGIGATAQLVGSDDYTGQEARGQWAQLTLGTFKIDAVTLRLSGYSKYTVTDAKSDASITFSPITKAWVYTDADNAWETESSWKAVERDVTLPSELTSVEPLFSTNGEWFYTTWQSGEESNGDPIYSHAAALVKKKSSKAVEINKIVATTAREVAGVWVYAEPSLDVVAGSPLTYDQAKEKTYTFEATLKNDATKTDYKLAFDVVLAGMPADKTFDLGNDQPIQIAANTSGLMKIENVDLISRALTWAKDVDSTVPAIKDFALSNFVAGAKTIKLDGGDDLNGLTVDFYPSIKTENNVKSENSRVEVNGIKKYANTITVSAKYDMYGVTYTYTATIETAQPTVALNYNDFYVESDGTVNLDNGTVRVTYKTNTTSKSTFESTPYALPSIDLRNYVTVDIPSDLTGDYMLKYTLLTPMKKADNSNLYADLVNADTDGSDYEFKTYTSVEGTVRRVKSYSKSNVLTWNSDLTSLKFRVDLISRTQVTNEDDELVDNVFASKEITLNIPDLVTFTADEPVKVKYVTGEDIEANIFKAMKVVDHFGNSVYNPWAINKSEFFDGYYATVSNKVEVNGKTNEQDDFFKVYGQEVVLPKDSEESEMIEVYLDGVKKNLTDIKYDFDNDTGILTLKKDNANITGDVEFRIKVGLTYKYDNYGDSSQSAVVSVVFSSNLTAEEENPSISFTKPTAGQWMYTQVDGNYSIRHMIDLTAGQIYFTTNWNDSMIYPEFVYDEAANLYYTDDTKTEEAQYAKGFDMTDPDNPVIIWGNVAEYKDKWTYSPKDLSNGCYYEFKSSSPSSGIIEVVVPQVEYDFMTGEMVQTGLYDTYQINYFDLTASTMKIYSVRNDATGVKGFGIGDVDAPVTVTLSSVALPVASATMLQ